jgi:hypothetical protein
MPTNETLELIVRWNLVPLLLGVLVILLGGGVDFWKLSASHVQGVGQYTILGVGIVLTVAGLLTNVLDQIRRKDAEAYLIDVARMGIEIDFPLRDGDTVQKLPIKVSGRFRQWPKDRTLWLFTRREGLFRPHKLVEREGEDRWSVEYSSYSTHPRRRTLVVFAVGKGGQAQIETYFRCCAIITNLRQTEPWPGMDTLGPDFQTCAERVINYEPA